MAVGGDDLDRTGQVVDRAAVEEPALVGQAHVGEQVPVTTGLVRQDAGSWGELGSVTNLGAAYSRDTDMINATPVCPAK